jgi:hypothetical protein
LIKLVELDDGCCLALAPHSVVAVGRIMRRERTKRTSALIRGQLGVVIEEYTDVCVCVCERERERERDRERERKRKRERELKI